MRRDGSKALDREEFKHALQIWGMEEESLNEVRTPEPSAEASRPSLSLPATAPGRAAEPRS